MKFNKNKEFVILFSLPSMKNLAPSTLFNEIMNRPNYQILYSNGHNVIWAAMDEIDFTAAALLYGEWVYKKMTCVSFGLLYQKKMRRPLIKASPDSVVDFIMVEEFNRWSGWQPVMSDYPPTWDQWTHQTFPPGFEFHGFKNYA